MSELLLPGLLLFVTLEPTEDARGMPSRTSRVPARAKQLSFHQIVVPTLETLAAQAKETSADEQAMPLNQMALLLVDWTDPAKVVYVSNTSYRTVVTRANAIVALAAKGRVWSLTSRSISTWRRDCFERSRREAIVRVQPVHLLSIGANNAI